MIFKGFKFVVIRVIVYLSAYVDRMGHLKIRLGHFRYGVHSYVFAHTLFQTEIQPTHRMNE